MTFHDHSHFPWLSRPQKFLSYIPRLPRTCWNPASNVVSSYFFWHPLGTAYYRGWCMSSMHLVLETFVTPKHSSTNQPHDQRCKIKDIRVSSNPCVMMMMMMIQGCCTKRWLRRCLKHSQSLSWGQKHLGKQTSWRRTAGNVLLVEEFLQFDARQLYLGEFEQHAAELVDDDAVLSHRQAQQTAVVQQRRAHFTAEPLHHAGVRQARNVCQQHSTVHYYYYYYY